MKFKKKKRTSQWMNLEGVAKDYTRGHVSTANLCDLSAIPDIQRIPRQILDEIMRLILANMKCTKNWTPVWHQYVENRIEDGQAIIYTIITYKSNDDLKVADVGFDITDFVIICN